ncbi:hypothetical protein BJX66DRAFT_317502 [Aspergillus keveii]|uniref:Zn(2)-C6 fungal-type domain-containing protein n=1 Tax=Aspergillus keveii TaxID=714993 RepID=A0ABR4FL40_9EURO
MMPRIHASRACDACRDRKMRCRPVSPVSPSTVGNPASPQQLATCRGCLQRDIPCTYQRPVAKRGPLPKRSRSSTSSVSHRLGEGSPHNPFRPHPHFEWPLASNVYDLHDYPQNASPGVNAPRAAHLTSPLDSTPGAFDGPNPLEILQTYRGDASLVYCLCSPSTWDIVNQDFLTYVYPLIPAVHIPTFLSSLEAHRTLPSRLFACLQASIFAIVNALLPSRFEHYKAVDPILRRDSGITDKVQAVFRTHDVFDLIKGPELQDKPSLTSWATMYLFGAAYASLNLLHRSGMFRSHTYAIMLSMNLHLVKSYAGVNPIETQLRKKAMWLTLTGVIHSQVFGTMPDLWNSGMARRIRTDQLLPLEVDDEYISETEVKEQPPGVLSLTAGFLAEKKILLDLLDLDYDNMPESPGIGNLEPDTLIRESHVARRTSSTATPAVLLERIRRLKYSLDDFSPSRGATSHDQSSPLSNESSHTVSEEVIELQRVNVYVTNYWAQNYLIERLLSLSSARHSSQQDSIPSTLDLWERREGLCRDLLHFLNNSNLAALQRNGYALIYKIRQVAAALLDCPAEPAAFFAPLYRRARAHLKSFTEVLVRIDADVGFP